LIGIQFILIGTWSIILKSTSLCVVSRSDFRE
jgi:hypothetical protein